MERRNSIVKLATKALNEKYSINILEAADQVSYLNF